MIDADAELDGDVAATQCRGRVLGQRRMERTEHTIDRLDKRDRGRRRREIRIVLAEDSVDQLPETSGHLDAGRTATDDDDAEIDVFTGVGTGPLEPGEQMGPQAQCVVQGLQREGVPVHTGDTERRADRAGGDDEVVVCELPTVANDHGLPLQIDPGDLAEHESNRSVPAEDPANREPDVVSVEPGGGDLVQQRLERVEVVGVDDGDVDIRLGQALGGSYAAEPGPDDDDVRATHRGSRYR